MATEAQRFATYCEILRELRLPGTVYFEFVDVVPSGPGAAKNLGGACRRNRVGDLVIQIRRGMGEALERDTFAHEVAHALLGHIGPDGNKTGSTQRIEAEANVYGDRLLRRWSDLWFFSEW
jgi:hypothetical protein